MIRKIGQGKMQKNIVEYLMIILAVDPGFDRSGYALFLKSKKIPQGFRYIISGLIQTSRKHYIEQRIQEIYNSLREIINKFKPDLIVIEQLFFFKNQKTAIMVSQAQGVILLLAAQKNIKVETLTPLQIKQIITGYGQADKKSVQKMLTLMLGDKKSFKQDDEADAVACGLAYCYQNKNLLE